MSFLTLDKDKEITYQDIDRIFKKLRAVKVKRITNHQNEHIIEFDDMKYRGNSNIELIPNKLHCVDHEKLIYTDFIDIELKYFPHVITILEKHFHDVYSYIIGESIKAVTIKPAFSILYGKTGSVSLNINKLSKVTNSLLTAEYSEYLDSIIVAELIRRFYIGEQDNIKGFIIYESEMKHWKALFEEGLFCNDVIEKILTSPTIFNIDSSFSGTDNRFTFKMFKNIVLVTAKKEPYMKRLDLKYMYVLEKLCRKLNDTRFGRR